jgi:hypothetical protein
MLRLHEQRPLIFSFKFFEPKLISTITELRYYTWHLMHENEWELLLFIAESGHWLIQNQLVPVKANKAIGVILADPVVEKELCGVRVYKLPWYLHNRHTTIRLRKRKSVD